MKTLKLLVPIAIASIALVAGACSGTDTFVDTSLTNRVETSAGAEVVTASTKTTSAEANIANELGLEIIGETHCRASVSAIFDNREQCLSFQCRTPHYLTNLQGIEEEVCVRETPDVVDYTGTYSPNLAEGYTSAIYT